MWIKKLPGRGRDCLWQQQQWCSPANWWNIYLVHQCQKISYAVVLFVDVDADAEVICKSKPVDAMQYGESSCWNQGNRRRFRPFSSYPQSTPETECLETRNIGDLSPFALIEFVLAPFSVWALSLAWRPPWKPPTSLPFVSFCQTSCRRIKLVDFTLVARRPKTQPTTPRALTDMDSV